MGLLKALVEPGRKRVARQFYPCQCEFSQLQQLDSQMGLQWMLIHMDLHGEAKDTILLKGSLHDL